MADPHFFDVIIIGGSYSGLSAAMALGRSLRSVLVIDGGQPCNRQTPRSHNFITQDGETPAAIAQKAKAQVAGYDTVEFMDGFAAGARKTGDGFVVTLQTGEERKAKKLVLATGIKDTMPDIQGFAECWGISVIHCPYCHGYEFRHRKTGILAEGERAFHLASLVNNLTDKITVLTSGGAAFNADQAERLRRHRIQIVETGVSAMEHENGYLSRVVFADGSRADFDAVYAAVPFTQHSDIPVQLGCAFTEQGYIRVDDFQQTTVKGVFACGDNSAMMRSVARAVYSGNLAGAMANKELTDERF